MDKASEKIVLQALDALPAGVIVVNAEGRILYINDAYERILGIGRSRLVGKLLQDVEPRSMLREVVMHGGEVRETITRIPSINRFVKVNILSLLQDGEMRGAVSFFEDATESVELSNELSRVRELVDHYQEELSTQRELPRSFAEMEGRDPRFMRVLGQAAIVAATDAPVLVLGENGTGKEVMARAIHAASPRAEQPFIAVNCAAVPDALLESELFGYTEGSFTGAARGGRMGKFELAQGGTIFLDEIGDMPLLMQSKLLRVLQEKEVEKLGRSGTVKVDVRVIAATNRDLREMVRTGAFREDLFYRLNVVAIVLPPLRKRGDDVLLMASSMLRKCNERYGKHLGMSQEVLKVLRRHSWPGNVRELFNTIEHAVIMCEQDTIEVRHLPLTVRGEAVTRRGSDQEKEAAELAGKTAGGEVRLPEPAETEVKEPQAIADWHAAIAELERRMLQEALQVCRGNKSEAMRRLGLSRRTFYIKLREYGLDGKQ